MATGITAPKEKEFNFSIGHFGTHAATADEICPLFWEAVYHLEIECGLKVTVNCPAMARLSLQPC